MSDHASNPTVLAAVRETGALLEGHFQLASGVHSDRYMEKFNLLQWPGHTEDACRPIAAAGRELEPTTVVGPTTGGVILAYEVARQLGLRGIIAERNPDGPGRRIQRDFRLEPGERVLVVDDVLTSGGSVRDTIEAVRIAGGEPSPSACSSTALRGASRSRGCRSRVDGAGPGHLPTGRLPALPRRRAADGHVSPARSPRSPKHRAAARWQRLLRWWPRPQPGPARR